MMCRLLYLLLIVCVTSAHRCRFHHDYKTYGHTKAYHATLFEEVSNDVIAVDRKLQNFCTQNSNGATKEYMDAEMYQLITPLADYQENEVEVKIRHRVLYINANKPPQRYSEIRLLPSFVETKQGGYKLEDGTLTIKFNVTASSTDSCVYNVNSELITVPKVEDDEEFTLGTERMGSAD